MPLHLLYFGLIPVGIFLLVKGIQLVLKFAKSTVLLNMPVEQLSAEFSIKKEGKYTIWQAGRSIGKIPVQMPQPHIYSIETGQKVQLHHSLGSIRVNDGTNGRILLFSFRAPIGQYRIAWSDGVAVAQPSLPVLMPNKKAAATKMYFIQVRESKPAILLIAGILIILLAANCIVAGLVLGLHTK